VKYAFEIGLGSMLLSCVGVCDYRRGLDWMTGFIDRLNAPLRTTRNYRAVADLHTLQVIVTHTRVLSRILATDVNTVIIPVSL
jgi:hypothetical protein